MSGEQRLARVCEGVEADLGGLGKLLEVNHHEKKAQGKYSLEGALLLKTHAALQGLNKGQVV